MSEGMPQLGGNKDQMLKVTEQVKGLEVGKKVRLDYVGDVGEHVNGSTGGKVIEKDPAGLIVEIQHNDLGITAEQMATFAKYAVIRFGQDAHDAGQYQDIASAQAALHDDRPLDPKRRVGRVLTY